MITKDIKITSQSDVRKKTYLFDFDGTLVDSMPAFIALTRRVLEENGFEYNNEILAKNQITIKKAATKLTAGAKTFKAKTKTKKYTITLISKFTTN